MCEEFSFWINKCAIEMLLLFLKARRSGRAITSPKAARGDSSCLGASSLYRERGGAVWTNPLPYLYLTEWLEAGLRLDPWLLSFFGSFCLILPAAWLSGRTKAFMLKQQSKVWASINQNWDFQYYKVLQTQTKQIPKKKLVLPCPLSLTALHY